jgi:hypothetical protein
MSDQVRKANDYVFRELRHYQEPNGWSRVGDSGRVEAAYLELNIMADWNGRRIRAISQRDVHIAVTNATAYQGIGVHDVLTYE